MKTREELHEYWRHPEPKNQPDKYIDHAYRTEYLVGLIKSHAPQFERISEMGNIMASGVLEIGCNVGRNLHGLWKAGYADLWGIEINPDAVALCRETYPDMPAHIVNYPVENVVGAMYSSTFKTAFSMCALMHIHPDSDFVFKEIARIADRYIITIEDEVKDTWRHCPRNYKEVFEPFGFEQVFEEDVPWGENGCIARVMKRVDSN